MEKYTKVGWKNYSPNSADNTPINQANLNHMDDAIEAAISEIISMDNVTKDELLPILTELNTKSQGTLSTDLRSDDREGWLNAEHGIYQIQTNGIANGYPANYMILINARRDTTLTTQLGYTSDGQVWTRTVNDKAAVLDWVPVHNTASRDISSEIQLANDDNQTAKLHYARIKGGVVQLSFSFKFNTTSPGKWFVPFEQLPVKYRPKSKVCCCVSYEGSADFGKGAFATFGANGACDGYIGSGISNNVNFTATWIVD